MTDMLRAMTRVCAVFVFGNPPFFFFKALVHHVIFWRD